MKYLLDTNVIIDAVGGCAPAMDALRKAFNSDWVGYSAITRLELFGYPNLLKEEEDALSAVIEEIEQVAVTDVVIDRAILLRRSMRIKAPDAIIAATALITDAVLVTRNDADFRAVPQLIVCNPWEHPM